MQYESWIDRQIREAMERGEFDNLPGAGKPLDLDDDPDWWIKRKIAGENLEAVLPSAMSLRKEVERLPETLAAVESEAEAVALVEDLLRRIKESYGRVAAGPTVVVGTRPVHDALAAWRRDHGRA